MENLPRKLKSGFSKAYAVALTGQGVGGTGGQRFRLGAVIFDSGIPLAARVNQYKTHTYLSRFSPYPNLHAESHAILALGIDNCKNLVMFVARVRANGKAAMARPCSVCSRLIEQVGIKHCYYTTNDGFEEYPLRSKRG